MLRALWFIQGYAVKGQGHEVNIPIVRQNFPKMAMLRTAILSICRLVGENVNFGLETGIVDSRIWHNLFNIC